MFLGIIEGLGVKREMEKADRAIAVALGGGGQILDMIQAMNVLSDHIKFFFVTNSDKYWKYADPSIVPIVRSPPLLWKYKLIWHLFRLRPKILHIYFPGFGWSSIFSFIFCKLAGIKIIWTAPNPMTHDGRPPIIFERRYFAMVNYFADSVLVFSEQNKNMMLEEFGMDEKKIGIVPYGNLTVFDKGKFTKEEAKKFLNLDDKLVIGHVGLVRDYKGIRYLYDAFTQLEHENLCLMIVGDWWGEEDLFDRMKRDDRVKLVDYIDEEKIEPYFKACDLTVALYTDHFRGYSAMVVTSFSFGIPVIASDVGSLPGLVEDGVSGKIVHQRDAKGLKDAIEWMINNTKEREEMSVNAKQVAEERLGGDNVKRRFLEIYEGLLS